MKRSAFSVLLLLLVSIVVQVYTHSRPHIQSAKYEITNFNESSQRFSRHKRDVGTSNAVEDSNQEYTIEVLVAVDLEMQKFHAMTNVVDIENYVLMLMTIASKLFSDLSIGNKINLAVVNIIYLREDFNVTNLNSGKSERETWYKFADYMKRKYTHQYDVALLLSREKIRNVLGIAFQSGMCSNSYAFVQDIGLSSAYTIAHSLGHLLGALHDHADKCSPFQNNDQTEHIMSPVLSTKTNLWSWSPCSRHFITKFLESDKASCLLKNSYDDMLTSRQNDDDIPNSQIQCQLAHGSNAKVHSDKIFCDRMTCEVGNRFLPSENIPWADGTMCDEGKRCNKGECKVIENFKSINGNWSSWKPMGGCSRTCGGGIRLFARECNNPVPQNGGKYCAGRHKKYESCNINNCPIDEIDFREQQCNNMSNSTHRWTYYNKDSRNDCRLFCTMERTNEIFLLKEKVIDGTNCNQNTFDKCVNGVCRHAGCDNILNSNKTLNKCGVCYPNNEICDKVTRKVLINEIKNETKNSGYYHVTKIPKGAANIEIVQLAGHPHDNTYIALVDDQGEYILNGGRTIYSWTRNISYGGVLFEYTGTNSYREKISTPFSKSLQRKLILQILSITNLPEEENFSIQYSYFIRNNKSLEIVETDGENSAIDGGWSSWKPVGDCSQSCGGGFRLLSRECNNPVPQNGGKNCIGNSEMYERCNLQNCSTTRKPDSETKAIK